MEKIVTQDELRAVLNRLLAPLPPEARIAARNEIEQVMETEAFQTSLSDGETRALLKKLGRGYRALRDSDADLTGELVQSGLELLLEGPSPLLAGELVGLMFKIRRYGVDLTTAQGLVLSVIRKVNSPVGPKHIGDALAEKGVAMTDAEVDAALAELESLLNAQDGERNIIQTEGRWQSVGI